MGQSAPSDLAPELQQQVVQVNIASVQRQGFVNANARIHQQHCQRVGPELWERSRLEREQHADLRFREGL